jgi:hypothetical protein
MGTGGFVREVRPQLFVASDRTLAWPRFMFVSSDRTWPPGAAKSLTWANDQPLVGADGPQPATAITSREHRAWLRPPGCGPKWRTFAVTSHERNHTGEASAMPMYSAAVNERCQRRTEADGKSVTESNLSLGGPAQNIRRYAWSPWGLSSTFVPYANGRYACR